MEGRVEQEEGVMRVLLVDDSPVDRRVVQLLLSSNSCAGSFHVIAVDSAKKAMEFLGLQEGKAIDMVLTDYCMPEMTGYDLLKAIKALNPLKPIPVIVMSSENEPQRISRCLNAGAEDFIVKPLQGKDVQRLRNCSSARPKGSSQCETVSKRKPPPLPHSDHAIVGTASPSGRRAHFTGVAMVLHSSSVELSQYFPLLLKLVLLVYAVMCLGELLHRWSSGGGCSLFLWCA
ncbi:two-component response regulator ORR1-like isoform X2 [Phragmites australis]|uniref:two-component response regulator ORR1-like isoform X2 n=1 Tax=Phragmites australis TaxID=29695 RepID=UPI002D79C369|nr:two-component response regulator ORR1-like isoform X2 [Phragmites australis]